MTKLHVVDVPGGSLAVHVDGNGPTILFIHGFPLNHEMWRHQTQLASQFRCVMPDLRGFGQSQADPGPVLTMQRAAEDLMAILDALGEHDPVSVCGLSMGGYIAFELWNLAPQRIGHLILCDTRAANDSVEAARGRELAAQKIMQEGSHEFISGMLQKLFGPAASMEVLQQTERVMQSTAPGTLAAALLGMSQRRDFSGRLADIRVPTLTVCGKHDVITPPDEMRKIAAEMPHAEFIEIADAGHMAPLEQPQAVNAAIIRFISSARET